jgi:hypothetical protein
MAQTAVIPVEFRLPAVPVADGAPEVPEVRLLRVRPGDVVVIRLQGLVDLDVMDAMAKSMKALFPGNEVVVLEDGAEIEVLRKDGA